MTDNISLFHGNFRTRLPSLCNSGQQQHAYHRTSCGWDWRGRSFDGRFLNHRLFTTSPQTTCVYWHPPCHVRYRNNPWPSSRRCFDAACFLAMVFLYQSANRCCKRLPVLDAFMSNGSLYMISRHRGVSLTRVHRLITHDTLPQIYYHPK